MKLFNKAGPKPQEPTPIPAGFKQVTYFNEDNEPRTALVPDKVNITFTDRPKQLNSPQLIEFDRSSLYTDDSNQESLEQNTSSEASENNYNNISHDIDEIIDSYAVSPIVLFSPVGSEYNGSIVSLPSSLSSDTSSVSNIFRGAKLSPRESNFFDTLRRPQDTDYTYDEDDDSFSLSDYTDEYSYPPTRNQKPRSFSEYTKDTEYTYDTDTEL